MGSHDLAKAMLRIPDRQVMIGECPDEQKCDPVDSMIVTDHTVILTAIPFFDAGDGLRIYP